MADTTDVLLKFCEYNWTQAKQAEDQRATFSNIILLIGSAVVGLIAQKGLSKGLLPLTIMLVFLGVFGSTVSRKYQERIRYHLWALKSLRERIDELNKEAQIEERRIFVKESHEKIYKLTSKIRPGYLWVSLHLAIALSGLILTIQRFSIVCIPSV